MQSNELRDAALRYADLGYQIFPLVPGKKHPLTAHGLLDATDDENQIEEWWAQTPTANVGLRTDGLLVLDVDGPENAFLFDGSADAAARIESLSDAPMQRTPRGGFHFLFRQPAGRSWRNTYGALAHHVDTRTNGGYIVVAPSRLEVGRVYTWVEAHRLEDPPAALPEPPAWLTAALDGLGVAGPAVSPPAGEETEKIPEGRRNSTLASFAGHMRRVGLSPGEFARTLLEMNRRRCVPPLQEEEVLKIAQSVGRYEPDQMASALAAGGVWMEAEPADEVPHPGLFPEDLLEVPGLIGEICRFNLKTAHKPQSILALAGAIALVSTIIGHKIQDQSGTQSNLYVVGLAPSGAGKDHARRLTKVILQHSSWDELIGPEDIASSAGVITAVEHQRVILLQVDELGRLLKTLRSPERSPHLYGIVTVFLRLFSSSSSLYVSPAYADLKKIKKIQWPHACLYGTTVPESFYGALSRESLSDGFIARLLVFECPGRGEVQEEIPEVEIPRAILDQVMAWKNYNPTGGNLNGSMPHPRRVTISREAGKIFAGLRDLCDREASADCQGFGSVWLRVLEKAKKLALVHAASEFGVAVEEIGPEAATWGARLAEYCTRNILHGAQNNVADSQYESDVQRVWRRIHGAGDSGLTKSQVIRAFQGIRGAMLDEILGQLQKAGRVGVTERRKEGPGRPATVFMASSMIRLG